MGSLTNHDAADMAGIFSRDGLLAGRLAGYEHRPGQLAMAEAVAGVLAAGHESSWNQAAEASAAMLAVEAGTGIGKTLAYLVPAVMSGQKIVVSTGTLNLQEQILRKDIPFIREWLDPSLDALCVKGRQNYLCLHRYHQLRDDPQQGLFDQDFQGAELAEWLAETQTGDRAELPWLPDDAPLWHQLSCTTSQCLGIHCPEGGACFINRLRKRAAQARVLIVNHHLFFSDLALRRFGFAEVLPRYESVIFDEAHHIEDVATRYFGVSFSQYQLLDMVADIEKTVRQELGSGAGAVKTQQLARALAVGADGFATLFPRERGRFPLQAIIDDTAGWATELQRLLDLFTALAEQLEALIVRGEVWEGLLRRCEELAGNLRRIGLERQPAYVYWVERREKTIQLSASPIEVAGELRDCLYSSVRAIVFTSATLTTAGNFKYFTDRLGLPATTVTLSLPTPFDYAGRTLLVIPPPRFPEPAAADFGPQARQRMLDILLLAKGRALVLFTSLAAMRAAHEFLAVRLPYNILVQGTAGKQGLLEAFRADTHSVLLAVASFWEGVDVPGEALSCVIIDKLPFEVPNDPVIMARMDAVREQGGNPFFDFQVPRAILTLRQGVGRLMRKATDSGLLALLDTRLSTKGYGRLFMQSLPPSPVTRNLEDVARFWATMDVARPPAALSNHSV